jgi:integrase/recombinase XerD
MTKRTDITLIKEYESYLRFEKGLAQNTIDAYLRDIAFFSKFIGEKSVSTAVFDDITLYMEKMGTRFSSSTIIRKTTAIRGFYDFLLKEGHIANAPSEKLDSMKKGKYIPEVISVQEIKRIFSAINVNTPEGKRDYMILFLIFATGARISEVLSLKVEDISGDMRFIRLKGKGNKTRLVPLYDEVGVKLKEYITDVRDILVKKGNDDFKLFSGMSRNNYWRRLKNYAASAGIEKNVFPHIVRHTVATGLLQNGADIRIVQEILGHASIMTTEIYTHVDKKKLKNLYDETGLGE